MNFVKSVLQRMLWWYLLHGNCSLLGESNNWDSLDHHTLLKASFGVIFYLIAITISYRTRFNLHIDYSSHFEYFRHVNYHSCVFYSSQDCFKASWSSHKSVHLKANAATGGKNDEGWLYCLRKGQTRTSKLPHFDWTGYLSMFLFFSTFHILLCM